MKKVSIILIAVAITILLAPSVAASPPDSPAELRYTQEFVSGNNTSIYVGISAGDITRLNPQTMEVEGNLTHQNLQIATKIVNGPEKYLYTGSYDNYNGSNNQYGFAKIDPRTMELVDNFNVSMDGSPPITAGPNKIYGSDGDTLYVLNPDSLEPSQTVNLSFTPYKTMSYHNGDLYISNGTTLIQYNVGNGIVKEYSPGIGNIVKVESPRDRVLISAVDGLGAIHDQSLNTSSLSSTYVDGQSGIGETNDTIYATQRTDFHEINSLTYSYSQKDTHQFVDQAYGVLTYNDSVYVATYDGAFKMGEDLTVQDSAITDRRTYTLHTMSGEPTDLTDRYYYNPETLIKNKVEAGGGVSDWSRDVRSSDILLENISVDPDAPMGFTIHNWRNGSQLLSASYYANGSGFVTYKIDNIDYTNVSYVATYRNGKTTLAYYPNELAPSNGTLNYVTKFSGYGVISVIAPRIDEGGATPICSNVTVSTNDDGQVIETSNRTAFQDCVGNQTGSPVTAEGTNTTGLSSDDSTVFRYEVIDEEGSFSSPDLNYLYRTDKVTIPRPDANESIVRAYVDREYVEISHSNVSIGENGSTALHEWEDPKTRYETGGQGNVTTNSTHVVLRGDVVLIPGSDGIDVAGDGQFDVVQQTYYLDTRTEIEGPGIINSYIDEPSGREVGDVSMNVFGGKAEITIDDISRSNAQKYGATVLTLEIHSVAGFQNSFALGGLVEGQQYTIYRGNKEIARKNASNGEISFATEKSGTYRVLTGGGPGLTARSSLPGGGSGLPWWILLLASVVITAGAIFYYQKTKDSDGGKEDISS